MKVMEITPLLYTPDGTVRALPPVQYVVPNGILGYNEDHVQEFPYQIWSGCRDTILGSATYSSMQLAYMTRIYEHRDDVDIIPPDNVFVYAEAITTLLRKQESE